MTDQPTSDAPYRVLARKYRPTTFSELIGQQAMVRTLTNAIQAGRMAHAFILTGVRGTGKTTTARLIARALNCVGTDGTGGPTIDPCGVCEHCRAIAEDRHMDVIEMDAASRTGVDDIRDLIDGVRYRPTSARFKVYIVDEVHMLSRNAFNALLKTLEEPPEHVKFIFATTEIRKVPVTVLSRCQRFDLRRVDTETLAAHFGRIAESEGATVNDAARLLIARAADGSVRDGMSLLDQAIAHCDGAVGEDDIRAMLGLVDRTRTFDLLDAVFRGDARAALDILADQYASGADPAVVIEDLLELVHWLTRIKLAPEAADDPTVPEAERVRGREMGGKASMPVLARAWQMLLKGLGEVRNAPSPTQAAEMVLVRLAYASNLPTPIDALKKSIPAASSPAASFPAASSPAASSPAASSPTAGSPTAGPGSVRAVVNGAPEPAPTPQPAPHADSAPEAAARPGPASFQAVVDLAGERREALLRAHLVNDVHLVGFEPGRIEFRPGENALPDLANRLSRFLNENTDRRWVVTVSQAPGVPTLRQQAEAEMDALKRRVAEHPLVKAALETFPGAAIETVARPESPAAEAEVEPMDDDELPEDDGL